MKKTQPLGRMPEPAEPISPITVAAIPVPPVSAAPGETEIPMALCWGLFGISAIVLLVQIWNYFS
jgi:hypothetical protein